MAEITLRINGRGYSMTCDDGQEQRLIDLSNFVNSRLNDIAAAGAATSEAHLLVLTALVMADEVFDLRNEVLQMQEEIKFLQAQPAVPASREDETLIAQAIDHLANRIEAISSRIPRQDKAAA